VLASWDKTLTRQSIKEIFKESPTKSSLIIADPDHVPLGVYTKEVLQRLSLYDLLLAHALRAHSARAATLWLKQRGARFAILYRSDAISEDLKIIDEIDGHLHRPIRYPVLICSQAAPSFVSQVLPRLSSANFKKIAQIKGFF
jgi:molybdate transport system substrate-binding protein